MAPRTWNDQLRSFLLERGAWTAALLATLASLPGLWMPFLSDDWGQIDAVGAGPVACTTLGDFRPLLMTTLWLDRWIGGLSPSVFHLMNLLLIATTAALVVILVRRYTGDLRLASASGMLFALHPFHVENAAWISARGDQIFAVFFLLAALFYDRWRVRPSGLPILALVSYEAALLAKETAVILPISLLLIGLVDPNRRPSRREWSRSYPSFALLAGAHFLLRLWVLGGTGRTLKEGFGIGWVKNGLGLAGAAIIPVDVEILAARPVVYGILAILVVLLLLGLARLRSGGIPGQALAAAVVFPSLVLPHLVGFEERYLFLAVAASSLFLASLIRAARGRLAVLLVSILAAGWGYGWFAQWTGWLDAAQASRRLVGDLVRASLESGTREIVIANAPFRVHGASVAGDLRAAVRLSGGRPLPVHAASYVSYPTAEADFLDGPPSISIVLPPPAAEVRLRIREGPFSHLVWPHPAAGGSVSGTAGSITTRADGGLRIRILPAERGRAAYAWVRGRLVPLFGPDRGDPPVSSRPRTPS